MDVVGLGEGVARCLAGAIAVASVYTTGVSAQGARTEPEVWAEAGVGVGSLEGAGALHALAAVGVRGSVWSLSGRYAVWRGSDGGRVTGCTDAYCPPPHGMFHAASLMVGRFIHRTGRHDVTVAVGAGAYWGRDFVDPRLDDFQGYLGMPVEIGTEWRPFEFPVAVGVKLSGHLNTESVPWGLVGTLRLGERPRGPRVGGR